MSPEEAIKRAATSKLPEVLLVCGDETLVVGEVVQAVKTAVLSGGIPGLNDDTFQAGASRVEEVLSLCKTLPMLGAHRFVMVRDVERWEEKEAKAQSKASSKAASSPIDELIDYANRPSPSTVLLLTGGALDKRRRLFTHAKKGNWLVLCETPSRAELPGWIVERARARGNHISSSTADLIAELAGPHLAPVADAIERLALFVGEGKEIDEQAVSECVIRLRTQSVWELVSFVGRKDLGGALRALDDVYDPQDRGLPLIGILGWATRQLIKFDAAKRRGQSAADAAKAAGAPPFKARDLEMQLRGLSPTGLGLWLEALARADLELKGGSRRDPRATLTQMVVDLCHAD